MNKITCSVMIVFCFFLVSATSCKQEPKPVEVIGKYGTGEISRKHFEINGKKEGIMTDYYPDGSLKAERIFENNIQVGKTVFYYKSGKIQEVQYYDDQGKKHGGDTTFYESGAPKFLVSFDHGVDHGYVRKWAEDGTLTYEARYDMGELVEVKGELLNKDSIQ